MALNVLVETQRVISLFLVILISMIAIMTLNSFVKAVVYGRLPLPENLHAYQDIRTIFPMLVAFPLEGARKTIINPSFDFF